MRSLHLLSSLLLIGAANLTAAQQPAPSGADSGIVRVIIDTDRGSITVALDSAHAPISVANFLRYVDGGYYSGGRFHRAVTPDNQPTDSVRIQVIQGGPNPERGSGFPPIPLERTTATGLHHLDGTL